MIKGKYKLELNHVGDGRLFINFWDSIHGNDVCVQVINNEIHINTDDGKKIISFIDFIGLVNDSIIMQEP